MSSRAAGAVLHWDFENAPVPRGASVARVFSEIRAAVQDRFGPLFAAYAYACPESLPPQRRLELAASGLDLVDCGTGRATGKPNVVDLRIVNRAIAELARGIRTAAPSAIVLVTGDGDFAHTLSTLRNFAVSTMLVFDANRRSTVSASLLQVAEHTVAIPFRDTSADLVELGSAQPELHEASEREEMLLQALRLAPPADDEGSRDQSATGELFHRLRGATEPSPERKNVYRATKKALLDRGAVIEVAGGTHKLLRIVPAPPPD